MVSQTKSGIITSPAYGLFLTAGGLSMIYLFGLGVSFLGCSIWAVDTVLVNKKRRLE